MSKGLKSSDIACMRAKEKHLIQKNTIGWQFAQHPKRWWVCVWKVEPKRGGGHFYRGERQVGDIVYSPLCPLENSPPKPQAKFEHPWFLLFCVFVLFVHSCFFVRKNTYCNLYSYLDVHSWKGVFTTKATICLQCIHHPRPQVQGPGPFNGGPHIQGCSDQDSARLVANANKQDFFSSHAFQAPYAVVT